MDRWLWDRRHRFMCLYVCCSLSGCAMRSRRVWGGQEKKTNLRKVDMKQPVRGSVLRSHLRRCLWAFRQTGSVQRRAFKLRISLVCHKKKEQHHYSCNCPGLFLTFLFCLFQTSPELPSPWLSRLAPPRCTDTVSPVTCDVFISFSSLLHETFCTAAYWPTNSRYNPQRNTERFVLREGKR